jgi:hypothetical protein
MRGEWIVKSAIGDGHSQPRSTNEVLPKRQDSGAFSRTPVAWGLNNRQCRFLGSVRALPGTFAGTGGWGPATFVKRCYLCATHLSVDPPLAVSAAVQRPKPSRDPPGKLLRSSLSSSNTTEFSTCFGQSQAQDVRRPTLEQRARQSSDRECRVSIRASQECGTLFLSGRCCYP